MNVLMLGWEFPPHITGGLGTACQGLVRGLKETGGVGITFVMPQLRGGEHEPGVAFVCADASLGAPGRAAGFVFEKQRLDGFFLEHVPPAARRAFHAGDEDEYWLSVRGPDGRASGAYQGLSIADALAYADGAERVLARARPFDVIHAHDWLTFPLAARIRKATNTPLIVHVHSLETDRAGHAPNGNIIAIERFGMHVADKIVAVSDYTRRVLVREYGIAPGKIDVVHNGVEQIGHVAAPVARATFRVAFVGRITHQKGPAYFLHAARKILDRDGDARFVMAGTGDLLPVAKALANKLGMANRIDFPGFLDAEGVRSLLATSSVYVMPSVSEPFGIGALEAAQLGVPVVLSRHSGAAEVMRDAIHVDPADTDAIAAAVMRIRANPAWAERIARAAQESVAHLDWKAAAGKTGALYRAMTGACTGTAPFTPSGCTAPFPPPSP